MYSCFDFVLIHSACRRVLLELMRKERFCSDCDKRLNVKYEMQIAVFRTSMEQFSVDKSRLIFWRDGVSRLIYESNLLTNIEENEFVCDDCYPKICDQGRRNTI